MHSFAVVTKNQKYIYWPWAGEGFEPTEELYDTENDPGELKNLVDDKRWGLQKGIGSQKAGHSFGRRVFQAGQGYMW